MSVFPIEAQVSSEQLLNVVKQLPAPELDNFVAEILKLRAQRFAPSLPQQEAELLLSINNAIPTDVQARFNELIAKRDQHQLSAQEQVELLDCVDEIEALEAQRIGHLGELARLRNMTLSELLQQLGLPLQSGE